MKTLRCFLGAAAVVILAFAKISEAQLLNLNLGAGGLASGLGGLLGGGQGGRASGDAQETTTRSNGGSNANSQFLKSEISSNPSDENSNRNVRYSGSRQGPGSAGGSNSHYNNQQSSTRNNDESNRNSQFSRSEYSSYPSSSNSNRNVKYTYGNPQTSSSQGQGSRGRGVSQYNIQQSSTRNNDESDSNSRFSKSIYSYNPNDENSNRNIRYTYTSGGQPVRVQTSNRQGQGSAGGRVYYYDNQQFRNNDASNKNSQFSRSEYSPYPSYSNSNRNVKYVYGDPVSTQTSNRQGQGSAGGRVSYYDNQQYPNNDASNKNSQFSNSEYSFNPSGGNSNRNIRYTYTSGGQPVRTQTSSWQRQGSAGRDVSNYNIQQSSSRNNDESNRNSQFSKSEYSSYPSDENSNRNSRYTYSSNGNPITIQTGVRQEKGSAGRGVSDFNIQESSTQNRGAPNKNSQFTNSEYTTYPSDYNSNRNVKYTYTSTGNPGSIETGSSQGQGSAGRGVSHYNTQRSSTQNNDESNRNYQRSDYQSVVSPKGDTSNYNIQYSQSSNGNRGRKQTNEDNSNYDVQYTQSSNGNRGRKQSGNRQDHEFEGYSERNRGGQRESQNSRVTNNRDSSQSQFSFSPSPDLLEIIRRAQNQKNPGTSSNGLLGNLVSNGLGSLVSALTGNNAVTDGRTPIISGSLSINLPPNSRNRNSGSISQTKTTKNNQAYIERPISTSSSQTFKSSDRMENSNTQRNQPGQHELTQSSNIYSSESSNPISGTNTHDVQTETRNKATPSNDERLISRTETLSGEINNKQPKTTETHYSTSSHQTSENSATNSETNSRTEQIVKTTKFIDGSSNQNNGVSISITQPKPPGSSQGQNGPTSPNDRTPVRNSSQTITYIKTYPYDPSTIIQPLEITERNNEVRTESTNSPRNPDNGGSTSVSQPQSTESTERQNQPTTSTEQIPVHNGGSTSVTQPQSTESTQGQDQPTSSTERIPVRNSSQTITITTYSEDSTENVSSTTIQPLQTTERIEPVESESTNSPFNPDNGDSTSVSQPQSTESSTDSVVSTPVNQPLRIEIGQEQNPPAISSGTQQIRNDINSGTNVKPCATNQGRLPYVSGTELANSPSNPSYSARTSPFLFINIMASQINSQTSSLPASENIAAVRKSSLEATDGITHDNSATEAVKCPCASENGHANSIPAGSSANVQTNQEPQPSYSRLTSGTINSGSGNKSPIMTAIAFNNDASGSRYSVSGDNSGITQGGNNNNPGNLNVGSQPASFNTMPQISNNDLSLANTPCGTNSLLTAIGNIVSGLGNILNGLSANNAINGASNTVGSSASGNVNGISLGVTIGIGGQNVNPVAP
ncbi:uncharacterized protein DDB_G0283357-like [Eupeodes corollae]|uniref:uncharacterized protein DDB_G0283357-like n=1 Tax=Eupeodes corollae TaxID=290404 RepID=UPI00249001FB|nr:uncharacterized protein DDB_G0283357-like [Eupeodes corollae]